MVYGSPEEHLQVYVLERGLGRGEIILKATDHHGIEV